MVGNKLKISPVPAVERRLEGSRRPKRSSEISATIDFSREAVKKLTGSEEVIEHITR